MNKYLFYLIICALTVSCNLLSQNKSSKSPFSRIIQKSNDTMTIYARKINCDSAVAYKFKIVKQKEGYKVIDHYEITNSLPKKCTDIPSPSPEKLVFKARRNYHFSINQIDSLFLIESLIRGSGKSRSKCANHYKFVLTVKDQRYESKQKECGQEILYKLQNLLIGEVEQDSNIIDQN